MESSNELAMLKAEYMRLVAKQIATEAMLSTLIAFIELPPLLAEVVLQKAADAEADAMQQGESADELLPTFLEEISAWQSKLADSGCMRKLK